MKIAKAGFCILDRDEKRGNLAVIEQAARTCYKSEDKTREGSADAIVRHLIRHQHEAMLEHGDYVFQVSPSVYEMTARELQMFRNMGLQAPMLEMSAVLNKPIISGNIRAWRELIRLTDIGQMFMPYIDPVFTDDIDKTPYPTSEDIRQLKYSDIRDASEKETHIRQTVRFIIDRGVSHEFVRHRRFSFAQESTRFCNYSQDKFGNEITVIRPCYVGRSTGAFQKWHNACESAEESYFSLLNMGLEPQEARAVLPTSLKTELVMTGTLRDWKHFFSLRALGTTGRPHPQAREVALPLLEMFRVGWPDVFPS